ncbi:uncharacterized protein LOC128390438 [Panonychus citri]|uniref:uncharacterized protein LOC128390438 n=1 Tax=Panonychus citri TaxID=50023 RepID=UPI002308267B|nr:uncharacterized protein LOC128390438 [Panonychus citri]
MLSSTSSNRQVFQAYQSYRNNNNESLIDLFTTCEQAKSISKLAQLPLSSSEHEKLVDYLLNKSRSGKLQAILCLLLNGKLDEAQKYKDLCFSTSTSGDENDDDLFQSGMIISAMIESYAKNLPNFSSTKQSTSQEPSTPKSEKFHSGQETQTPFTDSSIMNESVRRRRSRKPKDQTPMPTHTMTTRASARKKSNKYPRLN